MINLLPQMTRRELKKVYVTRYVIAIFVFCCCVAGIALVLMVPSLLLSGVKYSSLSLEHTYLTEHESVKEHSAMVAQFDDVNRKISNFQLYKNDFRISHYVVAPIAEHRFSRIQIDQILFDAQRNEEKGEGLVEVRGIADSREDLLGYVEKLRSDERFLGVDIPVQNFAENEELSFYVYVYLKPLNGYE